MAAATMSRTAITNRMVTNTAAGDPGIEWDRAGSVADMTATTTMGITAAATAGVRLPPGPTARRRHPGPCRRSLGIPAAIEYYRHPASRSVARWKKLQIRLGSR
jgi:hypothetical protein